MSRGSTLTLYRAYKNFKVPEEIHEKVVKSIIEYDKKSWHSEFNKFGADFESRLSPVLNVYDALNLGLFPVGRPKPSTIDELREREYTGYYLREDRMWCDKLLSWDFSSGFDSLIEEYNLNYYGFANNAVLIAEEDARLMLSALDYLLSGRWDRRAEEAMHNRYIRLFADGGNAYAYSKYVDRERWARNMRVHSLECPGCKVTVELPSKLKGRKSDEDYWLEESRECDETMEIWFRDFANGLRAYLLSDNWQLDRNDAKLVLLYNAWG